MCSIKGKDKSKQLSKRYSKISKVTKTDFCRTDDEFQLLLESIKYCQKICKFHE